MIMFLVWWLSGIISAVALECYDQSSYCGEIIFTFENLSESMIFGLLGFILVGFVILYAIGAVIIACIFVIGDNIRYYLNLNPNHVLFSWKSKK